MVQIDAQYNGELLCSLTHGPSSTRMLTDAPVDNMGRGSSFSPTDLVAASLLSCMITTMGIFAKKNGFELGACTGSVKKIMTSSPTRRIAGLPVELRLETQYSDEQFRILKLAAETCPVKESLHPSIEVTIDWTTKQ